MLAPSNLNWTPAIPEVVRPATVGSEALAARVTVPEMVPVGEVKETTGEVMSGRVTVQLWLVTGLPPVQPEGELVKTVLICWLFEQVPQVE